MQQGHLHEYDTFSVIIDPVIYVLSHTARTTTFYQTNPPTLNFKVSSLQDNVVHRFRALLLLVLRCCPDISIVAVYCC